MKEVGAVVRELACLRSRTALRLGRVENRADSVGEVPWLRIEHLLNQMIVLEELLALQGMIEAFTSSSLSS